MRKLRRPAVLIPTLSAGQPGGRKAKAHETTRSQNPAAPLSFPPHWNAPDVRGALYAMHGRACAYCQCDLPRNYKGDVEHFRPKAIYWWLAYDFTNYFLSCSTCNSVHKRSQFPLPAGVVPLTYEARARLGEEPRLLLDPVLDPVEDWLRVDLHDKRYRVEPSDLPPGSVGRERAFQTIETLKLNEDPPLVQQRMEFVNQALLAIEPARTGDPAKRKELTKSASRYRPHGFAVRQLLAATAPELIPSAEEELLDLVLDFLLALDHISTILAESPASGLAKRQKDEICWALAVLWKDPPAADPATIETWLQKAGRHTEVAAYYGRL